MKDRYEAYAIGLGSKSPGFITKEEIRAFEELSGTPNGELWSPENMVPDSKRGENNETE
jgi:hypothetical protein